MTIDRDEQIVIDGPRPRITNISTVERRKLGVKSLQRDLRRQIMRWDWYFQRRWTHNVLP